MYEYSKIDEMLYRNNNNKKGDFHCWLKLFIFPTSTRFFIFFWLKVINAKRIRFSCFLYILWKWKGIIRTYRRYHDIFIKFNSFSTYNY